MSALIVFIHCVTNVPLTTEGCNTQKYSLNRWLSLKVHHWATILRFLTTIWFLQFHKCSVSNWRKKWAGSRSAGPHGLEGKNAKSARRLGFNSYQWNSFCSLVTKYLWRISFLSLWSQFEQYRETLSPHPPQLFASPLWSSPPPLTSAFSSSISFPFPFLAFAALLLLSIPLTWEWPERAKNRDEPRKMTHCSETEIFVEVVWMGKF